MRENPIMQLDNGHNRIEADALLHWSRSSPKNEPTISILVLREPLDTQSVIGDSPVAMDQGQGFCGMYGQYSADTAPSRAIAQVDNVPAGLKALQTSFLTRQARSGNGTRSNALKHLAQRPRGLVAMRRSIRHQRDRGRIRFSAVLQRDRSGSATRRRLPVVHVRGHIDQILQMDPTEDRAVSPADVRPIPLDSHDLAGLKGPLPRSATSRG